MSLTVAAPLATAQTPSAWVLDTNIVLDLWVFDDPATHALRHALGVSPLLAHQAVRSAPTPMTSTATWLATPRMREELARVLHYPHLVRRQALDAHIATEVLTAYDRCVTWCEPAPKAPYTCKDPDDQPFIDLAVRHAHPQRPIVLLSKDRAVLRWRKRLAQVGVWVGPRWPLPLSAPMHTTTLPGVPAPESAPVPESLFSI